MAHLYQIIPLASIALEYCRARNAAKKAKANLVKASERLGACENDNREYYEEGNIGFRCYDRIGDWNEWCDICKQRQPYWITYHKASILQGALLRKLQNMCDKYEEGK